MGAYNVGIKDILAAGGLTLALLIGLSVYSLAVLFERWKHFRRNIGAMAPFLERARRLVAEGDLKEALALCKRHPGPAASVLMASLMGSANRSERRGAVQREIERQTALLERRLPALGTIGSTAPFIGLFGTVLGVMRAFRDLAHAANAGPGVVAVGISEALVATAAGLFVAIPAIIGYNYFTTRANQFSDEMAWLSDEVLDRLTEKTPR